MSSMTVVESPLIAQARKAAKASAEAKANRSKDHFDPTTSDRQYTKEESEYMKALIRYKTESGKVYLSETDRFRVMLSLGYSKLGHFG